MDKDQIHRPAFTKDGVTIPEHEQDWRPSKEVKLDHRSHPVEYFFLFLSLGFWKGCAETSQQYMHKARSEGVKKYPNAKRITIVTVLVFVACLLVNGLNPSPSQDQLFRDESMARGAHRVSDLMTRTRWWEVRAFFHVSDPTRKGGAYERGEAKFDELHKVRPLLDEFQRNAQRLVVPGKTCAMDEITIGFQGHHANLKQRCGKFKRAGDGFQADALVLRGGYVYAFVFRGDNTIPTIPGFSPLHNRCLYLLSFLFGTGLSGFWLFWDNLYPTLKVVAQIALGNALKAKIKGGPNTGKEITINIPKILSAGTCRTNRGIPKSIIWPKLSGSAEEQLKALPLSQRVKAQMTTDDAHVLTITVYDNAPVYIMTTIHDGVEFVEVFKRVHDADMGGRKSVSVLRLECINDYNGNMNYVDVSDQLAKYYEIDGGSWRFRKWWHCIFHAFTKRAVDQAYLIYKKKCAEAEAARAASRARRRGSPAGRTRTASRKKIAPMTHYRFQEEVVTGLVITAYNHLCPSSKPLDLSASWKEVKEILPILKAEAGPAVAVPPSSGGDCSSQPARGDPSSRATGGTSGNTDASKKRRPLAVSFDDTVVLPTYGNGHDLAQFPKKTPSQSSPYCVWPHCKKGEDCKVQKCGEGMARVQSGRSRTQYWCPKCERAFHPECWVRAHGLITDGDAMMSGS